MDAKQSVGPALDQFDAPVSLMFPAGDDSSPSSSVSVDQRALFLQMPGLTEWLLGNPQREDRSVGGPLSTTDLAALLHVAASDCHPSVCHWLLQEAEHTRTRAHTHTHARTKRESLVPDDGSGRCIDKNDFVATSRSGSHGVTPLLRAVTRGGRCGESEAEVRLVRALCERVGYETTSSGVHVDGDADADAVLGWACEMGRSDLLEALLDTTAGYDLFSPANLRACIARMVARPSVLQYSVVFGLCTCAALSREEEARLPLEARGVLQAMRGFTRAYRHTLVSALGVAGVVSVVEGDPLGCVLDYCGLRLRGGGVLEDGAVLNGQGGVFSTCRYFASLYTRQCVHERLTDPVVRDLATVIGSPSPYGAHFGFSKHGTVDDGCAQLWIDASLDWLLRLEADPTPLHAFIEAAGGNTLVLGNYFASLLEYFFTQSPFGKRRFARCVATVQVMQDTRVSHERSIVYEREDPTDMRSPVRRLICTDFSLGVDVQSQTFETKNLDKRALRELQRRYRASVTGSVTTEGEMDILFINPTPHTHTKPVASHWELSFKYKVFVPTATTTSSTSAPDKHTHNEEEGEGRRKAAEETEAQSRLPSAAKKRLLQQQEHHSGTKGQCSSDERALLNYLGPHMSETAYDKCTKLEHQMGLAWRSPRCVGAIEEAMGVSLASCRRLAAGCLVRGFLLHPLPLFLSPGEIRTHPDASAMVNPRHRRGWYLCAADQGDEEAITRQLEKLVVWGSGNRLQTTQTRWYVVRSKRQWLSELRLPVDQCVHAQEKQGDAKGDDAQYTLHTIDSLCKRVCAVRAHFAGCPRKKRLLVVQLVLRGVHWEERSRGFILEQSWIDTAQRTIARRKQEYTILDSLH